MVDVGVVQADRLADPQAADRQQGDERAVGRLSQRERSPAAAAISAARSSLEYR
jgi:hypothetical protein